jgi:membrane protein
VALRAFRGWLGGGVIHWGAAIAYYALISIAPLLLLGVGVAGLALDARRAGAALVTQLEAVLGPRGAAVAELVLREGSFPGFGSVEALGSVALLLVTASAVFANLRGALNAVWGVEPGGGGLRHALRTRLVALGTILAMGLVIVASVALTTAVNLLAPRIEELLPGGGRLARGLDVGVSVAVLWLAFAALFRLLPDARIAWRDVWTGGFATALLFVGGKTLIAAWLARSSLGSAWGAAGSVFLFLVWLYYSAQIFLLGATFTREWARARGREPGGSGN